MSGILPRAEATAGAGRRPRRRSLYEEQASRRRHARWWALLAAPAALVTGLPLAAVLSPLVFGAAVLALRLVDLAVPLPERLWAALRSLAGALPAAVDRWADGGSVLDAPVGELLAASGMLLVPGLVAAALLRATVSALGRRVGTAAELARLGAREPRPDDAEERQLVNVVEEMALAAGVAPPTVRVTDDPSPAAALLGSTPEDGVVVVTRGVLDRCDRAATQGVVAHLVASQINGDPRVGRAALALFQTFGLAFATLDLLVGWSPSAARDLRTAVRGAWGRRGGGEPARRLAALLATDPTALRDDGLYGVFSDACEEAPRTRVGKLLGKTYFLFGLVAPVLLVVALVLLLRLQVLMLHAVIVGLAVAGVLRARRHLADATAVVLTRDPEAVASGLEALRSEGPPPGGPWLEHRFAVGPSGGRGGDAPIGGLVAPHPALGGRLARLVELGAAPEAGRVAGARRGGLAALRRALGRFRELPPGRRLARAAIALLVAPLIALCLYLVLLVPATLIGLAAGGSVGLAAIALRLIDWLLLPGP